MIRPEGNDAREQCQGAGSAERWSEIVHQTADTRDGRASTGIGAGVRYDLSETEHLLGYFGPGLQDTAQTSQYSWYASILFTF